MARLLLVSNRLPVTVKGGPNGLDVVPSAGGLATGLRGPHQRSGGQWLGWPGDVTGLSAPQRSTLEEKLQELHLIPLYLSVEEASRYYEGFSNRVLWPLFHYLLDRIPEHARDWDAYCAVNERFADAAAALYRTGDTVWVHDYQLCLLPRLLRERVPHARIGFFLHIPFPSSEIFRTLPWRAEILLGLLGADLIGFHTLSYVRHFSNSLVHVLGMSSDVDCVPFGGRTVRLGAFPMGVDAQSFDVESRKPTILSEVSRLREEAPGRKLLVGVDRLDYTKGLLRRLLAVERLFDKHSQWRGRIRLVQVAVPSRTAVEDYERYRHQVDELVGRINGAYGTAHQVPIHYLFRSVSFAELVALYRAADVMLVTPLRDGMNLVAKEFVAARSDTDGVLVLSEFAGAASELGAALLVNPYDVQGMSDEFARALAMPKEERRLRMESLRTRVLGHDVQAWAEGFVHELEARTPPWRSETTPLDDLARRLALAPALCLLLDYDGTLRDFTPLPELAVPDAELLGLLSALAKRPRTWVHVVSGRKPDFLERTLGHLPVGLHAEHGLFSRAGPEASWRQLRQVPTEWKERVRPLLQSYVDRTPGTFIEEKAAALVWHYRKAEPHFAHAQARELQLHLSQAFSNAPVELLPGDKVLEVRTQGVNKGLVAAAALKACPPGTRVLALGDDLTDEDLFAALPEDAVSVHVGPRPSRATYRLADVAAARRFLRALLESSSAAIYREAWDD